MNDLNTQLKFLDKLLVGLKSIDDSQFLYSQFVYDYEIGADNSLCGTVCCAYGWMPKFVPEAGVRWIYGGINEVTVTPVPATLLDKIHRRIVGFMFYGSDLLPMMRCHADKLSHMNPALIESDSFMRVFGLSHTSCLSQVINRIEAVLHLYKSMDYETFIQEL